MRGRCARLQRVESGRARAGRAAYLVGWTKPLRRALGVIGEVGGGGSTARKGNDDAGGTRSGFEGVPVATADLERGGGVLQEPPTAGWGKSWA